MHDLVLTRRDNAERDVALDIAAGQEMPRDSLRRFVARELHVVDDPRAVKTLVDAGREPARDAARRRHGLGERVDQSLLLLRVTGEGVDVRPQATLGSVIK